MAWLELDNRTGYFKLALRLNDRKIKRSLQTDNRREAESIRGTVEYTLHVSSQTLAFSGETVRGAADWMRVASDGRAIRCVRRSRRYSQVRTLNFLAVCTIEVSVSKARVPRMFFVCRLTSRRRAFTRAPSSAGLLCNGTSG